MADGERENSNAGINTQMGQESGLGTGLPTIISFDPNVDSIDVLTRQVQDAYIPSKQFFGKDVTGIKVNLLYTRDEMDKAYGQKTPNWLVAFAGKEKTITIFSPSVLSQVSPHPASDFQSLLAHDITHEFTQELYKLKYPRWLAEGLSCYIAEQYKTRAADVPLVEDFADIHDIDGWNKTNPYNQAFSFTAYLIKRFGKETMLSLLQSLSPDIAFQEFSDNFLDAYKSDFSSCIGDWAKDLDDAKQADQSKNENSNLEG